MFFSTKPTSSLTFARLGYVPIALAVKALRHNGVLNEDLTVMEFPIMHLPLFNKDVSFLWGPHLNVERAMCFLLP
jgi:hypothetical protein